MRRLIKSNNKAVAQVVGGMVVLLIAIIIGILVFYNVNENIDFPDLEREGGWTGGTPTPSFNASMTTWGNINTTASTVWTLAPIVAIVMIASIILVVVMDFGRRPGM